MGAEVQEPLPKPLTPPWPLTKEQLGFIMQCSSETLNDALINDLARCVADCEMDTLELVYFRGNAVMSPAVCATRSRFTTAAITRGAATLATQSQAMASGLLAPAGSKSRRYNHQSFANAIGDPKIMELGKQYTSENYPWSISGHWWKRNGMKEMCAARKECTNYQIDEIGAKVNGRMRPNGADDRISYTDRAYRTLDWRLRPPRLHSHQVWMGHRL